VSTGTAEALRRSRERIVDEALRKESALRAELREAGVPVESAWELISAERSLDFLAEALEAEEPSLFREYLAWAASVAHGHRLPAEFLQITLRALRDAVEGNLLPAEATEAAAALNSGMRSLAKSEPVPPSYLREDNPHLQLSRDFLDCLLQGDRHRAAQRVLQAVDRGLDIRELYLGVFQPVMHEVGRLWQLGEISVAQEHFCTAATQLVMSMLYLRTFRGKRRGLKLVAACVGRERHEIGVRMVSDFFELDGWDTYYLGADTPAESVLYALETFGADVLALSTTMVYHIPTVRRLVAELRKSRAGRRARILVGGYPFNSVPQLWKRVGADGTGKSAEEAVAVAERLVVEGRGP
jgi:methanogenic corrinoid protein MtbC1